MKGNFTLDLDNAATQALWDECQKAEDENAQLAKALRHCKGLFEDIRTEEDLQLVCGLCGNGLTKWETAMKTWQQFEVGDVVSRMGDDEQVIVGINDLGDMLDLRCIKSNDVFSVGDTECNCADMYEYIRSPNASREA